jgi:PhnB protein
MDLIYKPAGYPSVSPYLIVDGATDTIAFLRTVFDAVELRRVELDTGKLRHAELRLDDTVIMLADRTERSPSIPAHVHVYVWDVDATYQRALQAGATSIQEPVSRDVGDRLGGVRDAGGTTWWIATTVV